jgi:hypothetical protein
MPNLDLPQLWRCRLRLQRQRPHQIHTQPCSANLRRLPVLPRISAHIVETLPELIAPPEFLKSRQHNSMDQSHLGARTVAQRLHAHGKGEAEATSGGSAVVSNSECFIWAHQVFVIIFHRNCKRRDLGGTAGQAEGQADLGCGYVCPWPRKFQPLHLLCIFSD